MSSSLPLSCYSSSSPHRTKNSSAFVRGLWAILACIAFQSVGFKPWLFTNRNLQWLSSDFMPLRMIYVSNGHHWQPLQNIQGACCISRQLVPASHAPHTKAVAAVNRDLPLVNEKLKKYQAQGWIAWGKTKKSRRKRRWRSYQPSNYH